MKLKTMALLAGLIVILPLVQFDRASAEDNLLAQGKHCGLMEDRVSRLLCFDELFATPVASTTTTSPSTAVTTAPAPLRALIEEVEKSRPAGSNEWLVRARPWHEFMLMKDDDFRKTLTGTQNRQPAGENAAQHEWTPQTVDIFMTTKQAELSAGQSPGEEAVLMLSCENDITTLGVLLPKPIRTLQAQLSLSGGQGSVFRLNWRDIENGDFVIAGRGLESIDTIKAIAGFERIQLQVGYPDGPRAFLFDIGDLKDQLKPLRTACHW
ncbi:type VI secretion protein [Neorhizobium sp. T786]|uniref:type VI secretion system-associated protein TagO n=1 Tax=Pseudorhizobium xiangyangii TaxID=2883104 RepID=UPI001CFF995E|nr:type VI secretion system-associated protein TagO [Neorhizobium xiangyangii]MCB5205272.1 type VI secretion protein [Neorhizobium xiangyangii]